MLSKSSTKPPKVCTLIIHRGEKKSIRLSLPLYPLVLGAMLAVVAPLTWLGNSLYTLQQNNTQLTESASEVLEELEDLDAEVEQLQERAGLKPEPRSGAEIQPGAPRDNEGKGGIAIPVDASLDAETQLQLARRTIPQIALRLENQVKPALEATLKAEAHRPQGAPVRGDLKISSNFGPRRGVFGGPTEMHNGMDFLGPHAMPIYATANGVVAYADYMGGYGKTVEIHHGYGYKTLFAHMSKLAVQPHTKVERGQLIGYMGSTGRSSGTHLHYTVFHDEKAIDPKPFVLSGNPQPKILFERD